MSTHNEVAHAWANQTGRHRKGFSMFYEGTIIYSWGHHFPIARIVETEEGPVVLMTTEGYSVSTAKHITYTRRAVQHMKVFDVPGVRDIDWGLHNARNYVERIVDRLEKAKRARKYGDMHLREAQDLIAQAQEYIRLFKVEGFETFNWEPDAIVQGVREAAARRSEEQNRARIEREAENRRIRREEVWPEVKNWLRGQKQTIATRYYTTRPLPRIIEDRVETTWGAAVPLEIAKKLYWLAVKCRREHREFVPTKTIQAGDFRLSSIKPNGDLVVGCHDIPFWFMRYAACRNNIPAIQPQGVPA